MKHLMLITILCLSASPANATFELEDPADPENQLKLEKKQKSLLKSTVKRYDVIITAGTVIYVPIIEQGQCGGWRLDKTESYVDESNQTRFDTNKTYMGFSMKTIDCTHDGDSMTFSLIKTDKGRLIWVESDKVLAAD